MKTKAKKVLTISLPVILATTTLAATAGTLVACSGNNKLNSINKIEILNSKINELSTKFDNLITNQITMEAFNNAFINEEKNNNIEKIAEILGIEPTNISSITATGEQDNATITINANNCQFITNNNQTFTVNGKISNDGSSLVYSNVAFFKLATITSFVEGIDLANQFITNVSSSEITEPSGPTDELNVKLTNNSALSIDVSSQHNDPYFNITLPNSVDGIFNVENMNINGSIIEWSFKEETNNFKFGKTDDGKQFIYNVAETQNNPFQLNLVATIKNSKGEKVANDVEITFNLSYMIYVPTNVTLVEDSPNFVFEFDDNSGLGNKQLSFGQNSINLSYSINGIYNTRIKPIRVVSISVDLNELNDALKKALVVSGLSQENVKKIDTITWSVSNCSSDIESTGIKNWIGTNGIVGPANFQVVALISGSFTWTATITSNDPTFPETQIDFNVVIDFH